MNAQPRDYKVNPDSETARLLRDAAASHAPIRVDTGDVVYQVDASATKKPYDPERMIRAVYASAGILKRAGVDAEQLEKDIYEDRTQNSTGRPAE
ncbi:MAG: hypothetical protein ACYDAR_20655 [Thermomicrobiales bacterium]